MSHYVYRNLQATEISKLQVTIFIVLYVGYIWPVVGLFILTSCALSSLQLDHFMKRIDMT